MEAKQTRFSYHVFLSFRGEDTRKHFTDHLYTALINAGFRTFRDDDEIRRGENIASELQRGIHGSKISLIVLSKNYATSGWCLDEFAMILNRRKTEDHTVIPLFYDVLPEDVKSQTGCFAKAIAVHEKRFESEMGEGNKKWMERVERWWEALRQVADLEGFVLRYEEDGHEAKFIQKIVKKIGERLKLTVLNVAQYPVGLDSRVSEIDMWVQDESEDVGVAIISGIAGVGKTTVAKVIYNLHYDRFEGSCFLANVRKASEESSGLVKLQSQLLTTILIGRKDKIYNVDEGITKLKDAIGCKRVLLVLDDVDQVDHLDVIMGKQEWYHPGSKIIITTRREKLLKTDEVKISPVKELDDSESLELFSWYAFRQDRPIDGFMEYSKRAIRHCGGLPLALKDLGSDLSGRTPKLWESKLQKLEEIPQSKVQKELMTMYNSLDDHDKNIFLLVASCFIGKDKDDVVKVLEGCGLESCEFFPIVGIDNLVNGSLITIDNNNKITMPQAYINMGKDVLRRDSPDELKILISRLLCQGDFSRKSAEPVEGLVASAENSKKEETVLTSNYQGLKRPCLHDLTYGDILQTRFSSLKMSFCRIFSWLR